MLFRSEHCKPAYDYKGIQTCAAAATLYGGCLLYTSGSHHGSFQRTGHGRSLHLRAGLLQHPDLAAAQRDPREGPSALLHRCLLYTSPIGELLIGDFGAIIVVKQLFGGIGMNFANPALVGRIVLFISFAGSMNKWVFLDAAVDQLSSATPLAVAEKSKLSLLCLLYTSLPAPFWRADSGHACQSSGA